MSNERAKAFEAAIQNYLAPVRVHLADPSVSEILINGPHEIFVERGGKLEKVPETFREEDDLKAAVNSIAQSVNRRISDEEPRLDARLPDGSRIAAVLKPLARDGTVVSIRKFTQSKITFRDYVKMGSLSADGAQFLDISMILGKNVLVSGGTGSGKTTLLSLLCSRIPKGQRIIVIEDSSELAINYEHVVRFESRMPNAQGKGEVTIKDLLKSSLRLRPDRIIVGEVRSAEAIELINAMNTGHKGCLGTVHANSPQDAIVRLEALASSGDAKLSERALRYQVSAAVDLIVQVSRFQDGSRRVSSIDEVRGMDAQGNYDVIPIYQIQRLVKKPDGKLEGQLEATGEVPSFMQEILDNAFPFPIQKFQKQGAA